MNKLTFLLPLKGRPDYTRLWLKKNVRPDYDYLVADGGVDDDNELLFRELNLPNLTYVRFAPDLSIECYVEKMLQAARRVKTTYVMTCDNDDFINFHGVERCIAALEENPDAVCAGGAIYGVSQNESALSEPRFTLPAKIIDAQGLHNLSGFSALVQLFSNYRYVWYSIFRADAYREIWSDIENLKISNAYLVEILQTKLTFCCGKYIHVSGSHYIRLENPVASWARGEAAKGMPHTQKIFFDDEYRDQVLRMSEHVAKLVGVKPEQLLNEFRNYYILGVIPASSTFWSRARTRLMRAHQIIPRKLHIFFPIEFCIAFLNAVGWARGVFRR
jgi:glycosyltransferase domain-containing protein